MERVKKWQQGSHLSGMEENARAKTQHSSFQALNHPSSPLAGAANSSFTVVNIFLLTSSHWDSETSSLQQNYTVATCCCNWFLPQRQEQQQSPGGPPGFGQFTDIPPHPHCPHSQLACHSWSPRPPSGRPGASSPASPLTRSLGGSVPRSSQSHPNSPCVLWPRPV